MEADISPELIKKIEAIVYRVVDEKIKTLEFFKNLATKDDLRNLATKDDLRMIIEMFNKRFDDINRRFEEVNKRFEDINKRFDSMMRWLQIIFIVLSFLMSILIAVVAYNPAI